MDATSSTKGGGGLRITIVQGPFFPVPPLKSGGTERLMEILGKLWAASGHQVTHISRQYASLPVRETKAGVQHLRVKSRDAPRGKIWFRVAELLYVLRVLRVLPPGDVVLINSVLFPFLYRKKNRGLPVVWLGRAPKGQFRFLRHLPLIQTISQDMVDRVIKEAPWMAGRVSNVRAPFVPAFTPLDAKAAEEIVRSKLITYVGRLHPEKGVDLLVEGFSELAKRHQDWRLQIIGPSELSAGGGGPAYLQQLKDLAKGAPGQVAFRGPLFDPEVVAKELRQSEIFVYPSLAENGEALGLAPIEAAGQGAVPILSDLACFRDFAKDGVSALIFDHRGKDAAGRLGAVLERAMLDPALRRRLRKEATLSATAYEADRVAARHLADYRRLLAGAKLDF